MDLPALYDNLPPFDLEADLPWNAPEPGMAAIYALYSPDGRLLRYIGKTCKVRERYNDHCALRQGDRSRKTGWLLALRDCAQRPVLRVLAWVDPQIWTAVERSFIAQARAAGHVLLNETRGGLGAEGYEHSYGCKYKRRVLMLGNTYGRQYWTPQRRAERSAAYKARAQEISQRTRGAMAAPEVKAHLSAVARQRTPEHIDKLMAHHRGRKDSTETVARKAQAHRGKKHSEATKAKMRVAWVLRKERQQ